MRHFHIDPLSIIILTLLNIFILSSFGMMAVGAYIMFRFFS